MSTEPSSSTQKKTPSFSSTCAERRLQMELRSIMSSPIPEVTVDTKAMGSQLHTWFVDIIGAQDTLYAGEKMRLHFRFTPDYPFDSPEVMFVGANIPVHPHVYSNGHICLSILTDDWTPALSVSAVCLSIISMLSSCKKKELPLGDSSYVKKHSKTSPKDVKWCYHDGNC